VIEGRSFRFEIRTGTPEDRPRIAQGTKIARGSNFRCILSDSPIEPDYVRAEGNAGRIGVKLMAVVAEGGRRRVYLPPTEQMEAVAADAKPDWFPDQNLPNNPRWFSPPSYGMPTYGDLYTPRQLVALTVFSDLILEAREHAIGAAHASGWGDDGRGLDAGGAGATAYGDAVATYLAFSVSKACTRNCSLALWESGMGRLAGTLGRQALPMVWSFAETNPFAGAGGDIAGTAQSVSEVLDRLEPGPPGEVEQRDVASAGRSDHGRRLILTDPPYYDNIGYADLSDFFYVWLRRSLSGVFPALFRTLLTPKSEELIAAPYRQGGKEAAEAYFRAGIEEALSVLVQASNHDYPTPIFYAFKQSETRDGETSSTGWETFLDGVLRSGFAVVATWPCRTETTQALKKGISALASSIVLVCRRRPEHASTITRGDFRRLLKEELPAALLALRKSNIAPVDLAQTSIGPGMAIFSRHAKVLDADDTAMSVRSALQLINQTTDDVLGEEEGEFDRDTRFALTWFEIYQFEEGAYGEAETIATARSVSVSGVADAGVLKAAAGKVRLYKRGELPEDWDPRADTRLTVWEATQHLIKRLGGRGEAEAARLLMELGPLAGQARALAYRLYTVCERKGWAEEAQTYNGLVLAWPELEKLAGESGGTGGSTLQAELFE